jgi:hypothetical protein
VCEVPQSEQCVTTEVLLVRVQISADNCNSDCVVWLTLYVLSFHRTLSVHLIIALRIWDKFHATYRAQWDRPVHPFVSLTARCNWRSRRVTTEGLISEPESTWYCGHYWPILPTPDDRWWWLSSNMWNVDWQWKSKYSEKTCPVQLCPPQIQHNLTRARTRTASVGIQRIIAWPIARL